MKEALKFLESINPSLKNEDVKNINTFSGEFLLYCIDKALKQGQSICKHEWIMTEDPFDQTCYCKKCGKSS